MNDYEDKNYAVSEVIGTLMMISFAVVVFTGVSLVVLNPLMHTSDDSRFVNLVGSVFCADDGSGEIVVEHRGGEILPAETKILITIGDPSSTPIEKVFSDQSSPWSIGKRFTYLYSDTQNSLKELYVKVVVIDGEKNIALMEQVLQYPAYIVTLQPTKISELGATLNIEYNFKNVDPKVSHAEIYILYNTFDYFGTNNPSNPDQRIDISPLSSSQVVSKELYNGELGAGTHYSYQAVMKYTDSFQEIEKKGSVVSFWTYQERRGYYTFESDTQTSIIDDSLPQQNGVHDNITHTNGYSENSQALQFDGDTAPKIVTIPHHDKFNLTDTMSLHAWVKPSDDSMFAGEILHEFTQQINAIPDIITPFNDPDIIKISDFIYAVAYQAENKGAYLVTIEIVKADNTTWTVVIKKTVQLIGANRLVTEPRLFHVDNDVYGVVFGTASDSTLNWIVIPVHIASDGGDITVYSMFQGKQRCGSEPNVVFISKDQFKAYFAISFGGDFQVGSTGYINTISIDLTTHAVALVESWKIKNREDIYRYVAETDILRLNEQIFILAFSEYSEGRYTGRLMTLSITSQGIKTDRPLSSYNFSSNTQCFEPCFIPIDTQNGSIGVIYGREVFSTREGVIQSFSVDVKTGDISPLEYPSFIFTDTFSETTYIQISTTLFGLAYAERDGTCFFVTLEIRKNGFMPGFIIDAYQFSSVSGLKPCIEVYTVGEIEGATFTQVVNVFGTFDSANTGFVSVVTVSTSEKILPIITKPNVFYLTTNGRSIFVKVHIVNQGVSVAYELSNLLKRATWNEITVAYDSTTNQLMLQSNDRRVYASVSGTLATSGEPIYFGSYHGLLDDVELKH